ncbi:hypothetical protein WDZ92_19615 [Nostoc sp. NIES-2111]
MSAPKKYFAGLRALMEADCWPFGRGKTLELLHSGQLPAKKFGVRYVVSEEDVLAFLENLPAATTPREWNGYHRGRKRGNPADPALARRRDRASAAFGRLNRPG